MDNATKLIAGVTALFVAAGGLIAALSGMFGSDPPQGITVVLDSPQAFEAFIANHPSSS